MGLNYEKLDDDNIINPQPQGNGYSSLPLDEQQQQQQQQQQVQVPTSIQFIPAQQPIQFIPAQQQQQQQINSTYPPIPQYNQYAQPPPYYLPPHLQQQVPQQQNIQPIYLQDYPPIPNVIVKTSQIEDEQDFNPALIIFVVGVCFWFVWFANIRYLKSKNKNARKLAVCSVVFAVLYAILILFIFIPLIVSASNQRRYYNYD